MAVPKKRTSKSKQSQRQHHWMQQTPEMAFATITALRKEHRKPRDASSPRLPFQGQLKTQAKSSDSKTPKEKAKKQSRNKAKDSSQGTSTQEIKYKGELEKRKQAVMDRNFSVSSKPTASNGGLSSKTEGKRKKYQVTAKVKAKAYAQLSRPNALKSNNNTPFEGSVPTILQETPPNGKGGQIRFSRKQGVRLQRVVRRYGFYGRKQIKSAQKLKDIRTQTPNFKSVAELKKIKQDLQQEFKTLHAQLTQCNTKDEFEKIEQKLQTIDQKRRNIKQKLTLIKQFKSSGAQKKQYRKILFPYQRMGLVMKRKPSKKPQPKEEEQPNIVKRVGNWFNKNLFKANA